MSIFTTWVRGRKTLASSVVLAMLAAVPLSIAIAHPGFPEADVDLDRQDVWVTNGEKLLGGRLNHQIGELDAKVTGSSRSIDVLQDGGRTLLTDHSLGTVQVIDPAFVSLIEKITVPVNSTFSYGKDTLAVLAADGRLWVLDSSGNLVFDVEKTAVTARLGVGSAVVVSKSGKTFALSQTLKRLTTLDRPGLNPSSRDFDVPKTFQLSAVGDKPVVLDTDADTLVSADGTTTALGPTALRLQQAGPENSYALVATANSLLRVPLDGSRPTALDADIQTTQSTLAEVSAPVHLAGCDYGAWAGAQRYLYACERTPTSRQDIGEHTTGSNLEFRVNHGVIALNNTTNGNSWIASSNLRLVNNWATVNPDDVTEDGATGAEKPVAQSFEDALANRTTTNHVPVAVDDSFGARTARTTVLPVLDNDTDKDGDILTITAVDDLALGQGNVDVIQGGRALQYTPPFGDLSSASFRYTVSDGRQGFASAQVSVAIRPLSVNLAPVASRSSAANVEVGQSIAYNVLGDWLDPDGDDIYLVGASPTTPDLVQFSPDGQITFTNKTGQTGVKQVAFTVSDGRVTASGTLEVTVRPAGSLDPVAVPDFASTLTSQPVVIAPIDNDLSPSGAPLVLVDAQVQSGAGAVISTDSDKSTITFTSRTAGSFYLSYTLAAGSRQSVGLVLVNVADRETSQQAPIAVKDTVYVRPGEPSTVDVLLNDVSPSGRVLVVQSVTAGQDAAALNVEVLANAVVRVTASGVLAQQLQLSYTISDGLKTATAGITVVPLPPLVNHQAPIAVADAVTVRAGDIASVHVLENDYSPDTEPFELDSKLVAIDGAGEGATAFVSGSLVRYQAPTLAGTYSVTYGISDRFDQRSSATVTFIVTPKSETNRPPTPGTLVARAFAGALVEVVVPLDGIDPDGDSVTLDGIETPPTLGRITATTPTSFTYQAYDNAAGTDTFTYRVHDTAGASAVATISVGIIARPSTVKPPTAVDDKVEVKPGKTASVPVLLNDSDPNGYTIELVQKLEEVQQPLVARVSGANVLITAPATEGAFVIRYRITNGQGGSATAFVQVIVTPDATVMPPTAADHVVDIQDLTGKDSLDITARNGGLNPSGPLSDLVVAVSGANSSAASVNGAGIVTVTPGEHRMAITYSLTDETTGLAGEAFIVVPARPGSAEASTAQPRIKPGLAQQVIEMNTTKQFTLHQILEVPSGRPATLTTSGDTSATNSDGATPFIDSSTLTFTGATDYRGPAAITFRINDGKDPGTTEDRITLLTLPITIGNPDQSDVAPTFTPPVVQVEAGETAQILDLRASTYHPNATALSQVDYRGFSGSSAEIVATASGSSLSISAPQGVQPGAVALIHFTVSYRSFDIAGSVSVRVVSSTRPVAQQKNPPQQLEFRRNTAGGATLSAAASDTYWINPFPDTALQILNASAVSAPSGVTVSHTATSITVSAGTAAQTGAVNITYTVQDATRDAQRNQTGRLTVTIHDVPDSPPVPSNVQATSAQATMTIAAPTDNHGKAVSSYDIESSPAGGGGSQPGTGTYTATGLTNGTSYTFRVRANNSDGASAWSGYSAAVTPYGSPGVPRNATIRNSGNEYAPATLTLSWNTPSNTGGGGVTYEYNYDGGGWTKVGAATSTTVTGGAGQHSFEVRATNSGSGITGNPVRSNEVTVETKPDPPKKIVNLSKGTYATCQGGGSCYRYAISTENMGGGAHSVEFYCNNARLNSSTTSFTGTSANPQNPYCGYTGVYVIVDNVQSNVADFR